MRKRDGGLRVLLFLFSSLFKVWLNGQANARSWFIEREKYISVERPETKKEQLCANRTQACRIREKKKMSRSIRDMLNVWDDITSPSHIYTMFDKTNSFSLGIKKEYGHRRLFFLSFVYMLAVTRKFFVCMCYYYRSTTTSYLKSYK